MALPHSGYLRRTMGLQDRGQSEAWIRVLEQLIATVNRIQFEQRSYLMKGNGLRNADQVKKTGRENLKFLAKKPQYLKKDLRSGFIRVDTDFYRPVQVIDTKSENNYDTPENRLLRVVLITIRQKLCYLKVSLRQRGRLYDPVFGKRLDNLERRLSHIILTNFTTNEDVFEMRQITVNQVSKMSKSYQDIYRCYLALVNSFN